MKVADIIYSEHCTCTIIEFEVSHVYTHVHVCDIIVMVTCTTVPV